MFTITSGRGTYSYSWQVINKKLKSFKIIFSVISMVYRLTVYLLLDTKNDNHKTIFSIQSFPVLKNASKHSRVTGLTSSTISTQWKQIWQSCFSDVATIRRLFEESLPCMNMLMTVLPSIHHWDSCMISDAFLWKVPEGIRNTKVRFLNSTNALKYHNGLNARC